MSNVAKTGRYVAKISPGGLKHWWVRVIDTHHEEVVTGRRFRNRKRAQRWARSQVLTRNAAAEREADPSLQVTINA